MKVHELIVALARLEHDTPVSHELLAELAPVDDAIYGSGASNIHPSIFAFRKQRYMRAAKVAKRAIAKLREAGWDARVTRKSIGCETHFVRNLVFVVTPVAQFPGSKPFCGTYEQQRAAEESIKDLMRPWPYEVDAGWLIIEKAHREKFEDALQAEELLGDLGPEEGH